MKKIVLILATMGIVLALDANAQIKPTQKEIGKDCTTDDYKLGTWKEVEVRETNQRNHGESNATTGSVEGSVGLKGVGSASASGSKTDSYSSGSSKSEEISYKNIRCVEDKSATLPQQSPVRW